MADTTFIPRLTNIVSTWLNQINRYVFGGATASALASLDTTIYTRFRTLGYYTNGDGGAGDYYYDPTDNSSTVNNGTVFAALGGIGRWKLSSKSLISLLQFGADPSGVSDSTAAVQAFVNAISSNTLYGAPLGHIPAGRYKLTNTITIPNTYINMRGDGRFQSQFMCDGVTGSVFQVAAITFWKPTWSDFSIVDGTLTTTGIGIDVSRITPYGTCQMYDFEFRNLYIYTKGTAFFCDSAFSGKFDNCKFNSSASNDVMAACGPAVSWIACYASQGAAGKCGYRLLGSINMFACNGVDSGDRWGVFGQDPTATDGYQNDFPRISNDYPDVTLIGCNVEHFAVNGITIHNAFKNFRFIGGKIDRSFSATAYESMVKFRLGPVSAAAAVFSPGSVFLGTGVPNGGAALTNAWLFAASGQPVMIDENGAFALVGVTSFYSTVYGGTVPMATQGAANDVYQGSALSFNAVQTKRLSLGWTHYTVPGSALTPVGTNQAIVVTGFGKVTVTPAAAASISTATFDVTTGAGTDFARNGDLLIEAGNGNLTVVHTALGNSAFRLSGGANITMAAGQILRFCFSVTSNMWIQV